MAGARTPATTALTRAGVAFTTHPYTVGDDGNYGRDAAAALGIATERMVKTLVATVGGEHVLAAVPVAGSLDLKALAAARGARRAALVDAPVAERLTGCVLGGIAPLGTRTPLPLVLDRSALEHETVYCSAGRRGLALELAPGDLVAVTGAAVAALLRS